MIKIRDLLKSYGSNHVLHGIDLDVKAGEFVVMLGLSGAGKSTFVDFHAELTRHFHLKLTHPLA